MGNIMRKLLLVTTTLMSSSTMVCADIKLSGSARVGLSYNASLFGLARDKVKVERRMTINIDGTGGTDGGLSFGGRIRLRSDERELQSAVSSSTVWLGFNGGILTVGNADGAAVHQMDYFRGAVGLTAFNDNDASFNIGNANGYLNSYSSRGNVGDIVRLDLSIGDLGISASMDSTGDFASGSSETGIAASYAFSNWNIAAQYTANALLRQHDVWSVNVWSTFGDVDVGIQYSDLDSIGKKVSAHAAYGFDNTRLKAWLAHSEEDTAGSAGIVENFEVVLDLPMIWVGPHSQVVLFPIIGVKQRLISVSILTSDKQT